MSTRTLIYKIFLVSLLYITTSSHEYLVAQDNFYGTLSITHVRPVAMGGAFTSLEDDIETICFNPGGFTMYTYPKDMKVTVFLNPLMSLLASKYYSNNFSENIDFENFLKTSALSVKSIVLSVKQFETGIIMGEESFDNVSKNKKSQFFAYSDLWNDNSNTVFVKLKLAQRVSIGLSGTYFLREMNDTKKTGIGFSYGIIMKPNNRLNVGLSYVDLPNSMADFYARLERIVDETMNIGLSYKLSSGTIIATDIRNLTEENKENVRELHIGLEQRVFRILAIRGGYFKDRNANVHTFSAGLALIDSNIFSSQENKFYHNNFIIDYAFVHEHNANWHLFSFLWHF